MPQIGQPMIAIGGRFSLFLARMYSWLSVKYFSGCPHSGHGQPASSVEIPMLLALFLLD